MESAETTPEGDSRPFFKSAKLRDDFAGNILHLFVLCGFAFSQPLFSLLGENAEYFAFRGSSPSQIWLLAAFFALAPAFLFFIPEGIVRLLARRHLATLHQIFVFLLIWIILIPPLSRIQILSGFIAVLFAALPALVAVFFYSRLERIRYFLTVLSPTVILFPVLFLFFSPVLEVTAALQPSTISHRKLKQKPPIVFIVFDEFSTLGLLDGRGEIDSSHYPNFARLAQEGTWFREFSTVSHLTDIAVPAVLTGHYPPGGKKMSLFRDYPRNLFTLLGGDYELQVYESATRLCPESLCDSSRREHATDTINDLLASTLKLSLFIIFPGDVTDLNPAWARERLRIHFESKLTKKIQRKNGGTTAQLQRHAAERQQQFVRFLSSVERKQGVLYFLHTMFPHIPYEYLPSGKRYNTKLFMPGWDWQKDSWLPAAMDVRQAQKRYLDQVEYVDRHMLGPLLRRLREQGIYNQALIIITADHGVSFLPGKPRRQITDETFSDIVFVPLFIKPPGTIKGGVSNFAAEAVDILPTLVDLLDMNSEPIAKSDWRFDGIPLFKPSGIRRAVRTIDGRKYPIVEDQLLKTARESRQR